MDYHKREIESLNQSIIDYQEVASPDAIQAAEERRNDAEPMLTTLMEPDSFERHLTEFLEDERESFNDGGRDEPLCNCSRPTCPIKRAELPPQIRQAESLQQGIRAYQRNHVGNAQALSEARDEFVERCAEVKRVLREALGLIRQQEIPEDDDDEEVEATA